MTVEGLSTRDDFVQIQLAMHEEDMAAGNAPTFRWTPAANINIDCFHRMWVQGLILCAESSSDRPVVSLDQLASLVESQQLKNGAFYPERVPWCTARVLLGLAACGKTVDTSPAVAMGVGWLLRDRADGGACTGGIWQSGTGRWNSTLETTGMVFLAIASVGHDCADDRLQARARIFAVST